MKKIPLFLALSIMISTSVHAQSYSQQWDKTFGGNDLDVATAMQQTMDGGYIIAGVSFSFSRLPAAWVLKLDNSGKIIWEKTYVLEGMTETTVTEITSLYQTSDGDYVLAGYVGYVVETPPYQPKDIMWDILVLKLDAKGDILWNKAYDGLGNEENPSIKQTKDGGYVVAAYTDGGGVEERDLWILKLDGTGNIVWEKAYVMSGEEGSFNSSEFSISIQETSDGGYIIADQSAQLDFRVIRLDGNGNIVWNKTYGGTGDEGVCSIQQTSEGGYVLVGYTDSFGSSSNAWILKLDPNGNVSWQKTYGGNNSDYAISIKQTADGGYVSVGSTASFGDESFNLWILRLSNSGNIVWQKVYSGEWSGNMLSQVMQTPDGGFIISTNYSDPTSLDWNFWILKLKSNGEIDECPVMTDTNAIVSDTSIAGQNISMSIAQTAATVEEPSLITNETSAEISVICYYEDPNDMDGDGVMNNSEGATISSTSGSSFLVDEDNCPTIPNGPFLGTCVAGSIGGTCIDNEACGVGGICSMNQEDTDSDGIGDVCDSSTQQIPTLSEWGIIIFMTIVMGIGVITLLRRKFT